MRRQEKCLYSLDESAAEVGCTCIQIVEGEILTVTIAVVAVEGNEEVGKKSVDSGGDTGGEKGGLVCDQLRAGRGGHY